jgi:hypothetical protein
MNANNQPHHYTAREYKRQLEREVATLNATTDPDERAKASKRVANVREYLEAAEKREKVTR